MRILSLIISTLFVACFSSFAQTFDLDISNFKNNDKGVIRVAIFPDANSFNKESGCLDYTFSKTELKGAKLCVKIPVKAGTWAITVLDDVDMSGKMYFNRLGVPKKGFGISNFTPKIMKKPKFENVSIQIKEGEVKRVSIKMHYLPF